MLLVQPFFTGMLDFLNKNSDAITALSVMITAIFAVYGINEWKRQLKGKTDYRIARRCLRAALKLRDAIEFARNPFVSFSEIESSLRDYGPQSTEYSDDQKKNRAVYSLRWNKVTEAQTNLKTELLEAEVSWGRGVVVAQEKLVLCTRKLFSAFSQFLNGRGDSETDNLIYLKPENDGFSNEILLAIEEFENFLRSYLK